MNEVIRQLYDRKSIRVFMEREIDKVEKDAILRAATEAPTAGNQQLYTILDITDQTIKEKLVETCDHQPMIAQAKMVLIFCADCKKWYDAYLAVGCQTRKPGVGDLMLACTDAMIAAQNAVTAAESLGIGSCYIGDIMENCETQRVEMKYIVHENGYIPLSQQDLEDMWTPRAGEKGYAAWMQAFCNRKYNSDFSREMTRSVAKYLEQFK